MQKTEVPEHPDIARTLRTGYPQPVSEVKCADCGRHMIGEDRVYIIDGDTVCEECTKERLLDAYGIADIAKAFDIYGMSAHRYVEIMEEP